MTMLPAPLPIPTSMLPQNKWATITVTDLGLPTDTTSVLLQATGSVNNSNDNCGLYTNYAPNNTGAYLIWQVWGGYNNAGAGGQGEGWAIVYTADHMYLKTLNNNCNVFVSIVGFTQGSTPIYQSCPAITASTTAYKLDNGVDCSARIGATPATGVTTTYSGASYYNSGTGVTQQCVVTTACNANYVTGTAAWGSQAWQIQSSGGGCGKCCQNGCGGGGGGGQPP